MVIDATLRTLEKDAVTDASHDADVERVEVAFKVDQLLSQPVPGPPVELVLAHNALAKQVLRGLLLRELAASPASRSGLQVVSLAQDLIDVRDPVLLPPSAGFATSSLHRRATEACTR